MPSECTHGAAGVMAAPPQMLPLKASTTIRAHPCEAWLCRLQWGCVARAARPARSPLAQDAPPCHDPALLRYIVARL